MFIAVSMAPCGSVVCARLSASLAFWMRAYLFAAVSDVPAVLGIGGKPVVVEEFFDVYGQRDAGEDVSQVSPGLDAVGPTGDPFSCNEQLNLVTLGLVSFLPPSLKPADSP